MDPTTTLPPSTLVGPSGTAPGMAFVDQQPARPLDDSTLGRGTAAPLAIAGVVMVAIFLTIVVRAWRNRRTPTA